MFNEHVKDGTIIHIPHGGLVFPSTDGFLVDKDRLNFEASILADHNVERIFNVSGVEKIICPWSRVFCDVERRIDGEILEASGKGYFYTVCDDGTPLRNINDSSRGVVIQYYQAHHYALKTAIYRRLGTEGYCHIIDAHTFPDRPFKLDLDQSPSRPDICLGTTETNTPGFIVDHFKRFFESKKLSVKIDTPYGGSMVPDEFLGNQDVTTVMIEVNRRLHQNDSDIANLRDMMEEAFDFE